jgi:hypothetical protein
MPLPPPASPPAGTPPVLWTSPDGASPALASEGRGAIGAATFTPASFRDVVIDAVVELAEGGDDAACGLFFRQVDERDYLAFSVTASGRAVVFAISDGQLRVLADGPIPADAPFAPGIPAANRLTVVAAGPSITCLVNGYVLVGVIADPRYKAGFAGAVVVPGQVGVAASARVRWAQVRALLPDQE